MNNNISKLFDITYPIIQGGMIWASGWKLASAVSNCGGLGLIGSGSMSLETLREHILKCKQATKKPFGVNIPLMYPNVEQVINIVINLNVPIVFTSAGNPKTWTSKLKKNNIKVAHVVSSSKFALKAQEAHVDAIVAEGFEAGGHNGYEETTTFTLIPSIKQHISIPLIAAGGIASGQGIVAAMALGSEGIQIGSRFAISTESSLHSDFKNYVMNSKEGDTILTIKELAPVRLLKNPFFQELESLYNQNTSIDALKKFLGKGRAKKGMFLGDLNNGELEIGQISSIINDIKPVKEIMEDLISSFKSTQEKLAKIKL